MKWIDVGTTALPRLLTEQCLGSLLDRIDVSGYRLRWIFHLDVLPNEMWSAENRRENIAQAERIAQRFNDAVLCLPETNQAYGGACHRVFAETRHDVLWVEDDWLWLQRFSLRDVETMARDGFNFHHRRVRVGSTSPTFWKRHVVEYLLRHFPQPAASATERQFKSILHRKAGFRSNDSLGPVSRNAMTDIGRACAFGGCWPRVTTQ